MNGFTESNSVVDSDGNLVQNLSLLQKCTTLLDNVIVCRYLLDHIEVCVGEIQ